MNSQNIQIGIDLGTTNSAIAVNNSGKVEIIKNDVQIDYTPSVFGFDKAGNSIVGQRAYEGLYRDGNVNFFKSEVKRLMGESEKISFPHVDKNFSPEEISGEIIKDLKNSVLRKHPDVNSLGVVITIPACFSTSQSEATKRAGEYAGFDYVVLVQEPIAAAISFSYDSEKKDDNFLVYDFGGGTFDVALVSLRDNNFSVISYDGDNFMGGKDLDDIIIKEFFIPKIKNEFEIEDFDNESLAKLKHVAENAKKSLSNNNSIKVLIEGIGNDNNGKEIVCSMEIKREDFESKIKELVDDTIEMSRDVIKKSGVKKDAISRVVLVGGTTLIPYISSRIEKDLDIFVDKTADPITIVAKGAAVYAITQKVPKEFLNKNRIKDDSVKDVTLNYDASTTDNEQLITGKVSGLEDGKDYFIKIESEGGFFIGTKKMLKDGKFAETVSLESNKNNLFWVYLFDENGVQVKIDTESFSINHGFSVSGIPLANSIGVVVATRDKSGFNDDKFIDTFDIIIDKGSSLPAKSSDIIYYTRKKIIKGDDGQDNYLPIKIMEGESSTPDRNTFVCSLRLSSDDVPFDLPEKTEIAINVEVDESRQVSVNAYIPSIDKRFNVRGSLYNESINSEDIKKEFQSQLDVFEKKKEVIMDSDDGERINRKISSIKNSLLSCESNSDDKKKADKEIKDLKVMLDKYSVDDNFLSLEEEYNAFLLDVQNLIDSLEDEDDKKTFLKRYTELSSEGSHALESKSVSGLMRAKNSLVSLFMEINEKRPEYWARLFYYIQEKEREALLSNDLFQQYVREGNEAISLGNLDGLKRCVINLFSLFPNRGISEVQTDVSGITKAK